MGSRTPLAVAVAALALVSAACADDSGSPDGTSTAASTITLATSTTGERDATTTTSTTATTAGSAPTTTTAISPHAVHVSPDGDDEAAGSEDQPVATLERAIELAGPGGEVALGPGLHPGHLLEGLEGVRISGLPGSVVDGAGTEPFGLFCDECRDIVLRGFEVRGFTDIGVAFTNSDAVVVEELVVHGNGATVQNVDWELEGYGIYVDGSSNVTIRGNEVFDNGPDPPVPPDRILGTGIDTYGNTGVVISNNLVHHNRGGGILVEDSHDVVVEGNEVYENDLDATVDDWWDGALWIDGGGDVVVRDNLFRDNRGPGIQVSDEDDQAPTGYVLIDNVSTSNYFGILVWGFGSTDVPDASILTLDGNDFTGNQRQDVWIEPDL